jgi:hypothetical protein
MAPWAKQQLDCFVASLLAMTICRIVVIAA